jgi:hypothetical protein
MNANTLLSELGAISQAYRLIIEDSPETERQRAKFYHDFLTQMAQENRVFRLTLVVVAAAEVAKSREAQ